MEEGTEEGREEGTKEGRESQEPSNPSGRSVWVAMSLCWGENAQVHGKENFPYR